MKLIVLSSIAVAFVLPPLDAAPTRLEARVADDETGVRVAARVAVNAVDGPAIEVDGSHGHVEQLGKRWWYVDGTFALTIPDAGAVIEIRRGLETRPLTVTVPSDRGGKKLTKTFRLRRWTDMRKSAYVNGDIHAHQPVPAEAQLQMRAEDLQTLSLLAEDDPEYPYPVNKLFTGALDSHSTPGCEIRVNQEVADWQMGHITLLGLQKHIAGYPRPGGTLEYWRSAPNWDLSRAVRATHDQKGLVAWAHPCSLPGAELPIAVALGWVDVMELITYYDPTQLPNHWSPWLNSGMAQAEFPVMRAMDLYYQFLNAGFRLPAAAGTDKFADDIPLGSNRTYAQVGSVAGYDGWIAAIKAGRTYVTNGPLLEFTVDGHAPGDVIEFSGARKVKVHVVARSILPFTTLEIVMNGRSIAHQTKPIPTNPAKDGVYAMELETAVEASQSVWFAARVTEHPDLLNRIMPRGVSVFAHTSPVYFIQDGRQVREEASIAYLRKYVESTRHWLSTKPTFASEQDRQDAERAAEEAAWVYGKL